MKKATRTTMLGASLAAAALLPGITQAGNPFVANPLPQGYDLANYEKPEGKCGEGKCGEGKCGAAPETTSKSEGEGKCGEGKCGEGKCGAAE